VASMHWVSHSTILREIIMQWYIVTKSPLRVGVGKEPPLGSLVELAVVRIKLQGKSVPYIPGSSLKGVFRSIAMQLAKQKGLKVCQGVGKETCMQLITVEGSSLGEYLESLLKKGNSYEAIKVFSENACLLCKIFGAPGLSSHVTFTDAYPVDNNGNVVEVPLGVRTGIAIDRRTGAVYERALYQVEYIEPGARFRTMVLATNLPNYAIGVLAKALMLINEGYMRIGCFKTRGFGEVGIEDLELKIKGKNEGAKLLGLDNVDIEVDLTDCTEISGTWLIARGVNAWKCLNKFEKVWDSVKFT